MKAQIATNKVADIPTDFNSQWKAFSLAHEDVDVDPLVQLLRSQSHLMARIENMKVKIQELELRLSKPSSLNTTALTQF